MQSKTGSGEPNEGIREPTRAIFQNVPAVFGFVPEPLASIVIVLAPGRLLALEDVSPFGLSIGVLTDTPRSIGLRREIEQRPIADRAYLPRNVNDG